MFMLGKYSATTNFS